MDNFIFTLPTTDRLNDSQNKVREVSISWTLSI